MRIKAIEIIGFGRWSKQNFLVDRQLQVFTGPNESGKSTIRAFIVGVLFGYPSKKAHQNLYTPKDGSQYGGSLVIEADHQDFRITRIGRTKTTLKIQNLTANQEVVSPEKWLSEQLSPLTRETFDHIFNFDQRDLNRIETLTELDFQKLLLNIGAVGSTQWLDVGQDLDKAADKLFAKRSTKRPINQEMQHYRTTQKTLESKSEDLVAYTALQNKIDDTNQAIKKQQNKVKLADQQYQNQYLLLQKYDLFYQLQQLRQKIARLKAIPIISQNDVSQAQSLDLQINHLQAGIDREKKALNITKKPKNSDLDYDQLRLMLLQIQTDVQDYHQTERQQEEILTAIEDIERQFSDEVPSVLSTEQQQQLTHGYNRKLWWLTGIFGVLSATSFIFNPYFAIILLALAVGSGSYFWQTQKKYQQQINHILKAYAPLNQQQILDIQLDLKQLPQLDEKLDQCDNLIDSQRFAIEQKLNAVQDSIETHYENERPEILINQLLNELQKRQIEEQNEAALSATHENERLMSIQLQQSTLQKRKDDLSELLHQYKLVDVNELLVQYKASQEQQQQHQRLVDLNSQITVEEQQILSRYDDKMALSQNIDHLKQGVQKERTILSDLQRQLAQQQANQARLTSDDEFMSLQQEVANQKTAILDDFTEYLALKLSSNWIDQALSKASQNRFPKMLEKATYFFEILTQHKYNKIIFDDHKIMVMVKQTNVAFEMIELSTGAREQLYVALRLALAFVINDIIQMPILIDDSFVNFDGQRKASILNMLMHEINGQQVLYWTTEATMFDTKNICNLTKDVTYG